MSTATLRRAGARTRLVEALDRPLVFVGGKGGVGKTTLAAALALATACRHPERRILLMSTDPAHSLRDALPEDPRAPRPPANLEVRELDAAGDFADFRRRHREGVRKIALRGTFLDEGDLQRFLDLGLPGLDELAALRAIAETVEAGRVDQLIVDTAPTGHTLRLLALPEVLERWRAALDSLMAKHRVLAGLFAGRCLPDEADALIADLQRILGGLRALLPDPKRCVFLPVMNADPLSFWETGRLLAALEQLEIAAPCLLLNRVTEPGSGCAQCEGRRQRERTWVRKAGAELRPPHLEVPCLPREPRGTGTLAALGTWLLTGAGVVPTLGPGPAAAVAATAAPVGSDPRAARARPVVASLGAAALHLVCGKGGVGKTTVAAALALYLAQAGAGGGRTLLLSTDPAHSLSDAFVRPIGDEVQEVAPGLDAVEIDPEKLLTRLRETYRREIDALVDSLFRSKAMDAALDREAMERLIDLSPPGLDEIMALAEASRYRCGGAYARIVLDTAPSGHFLRFLELPELVRAWLRAFFEILLKYRSIFCVPRLQALLVKLSKAIREVQGLVHDDAASCLLMVAIPTELSFEETRDLYARASALGARPRLAVLNHVVRPAGSCRACGTRAGASAAFGGRYRAAFPEVPFLVLEEQAEHPVGVERLHALGTRLFGPV